MQAMGTDYCRSVCKQLKTADTFPFFCSVGRDQGKSRQVLVCQVTGLRISQLQQRLARWIASPSTSLSSEGLPTLSGGILCANNHSLLAR